MVLLEGSPHPSESNSILLPMVRVSVGMPVYNADRYVSEALDSLLSQTFTDFEIYVSDNASTDRTREVVESYAARDSRILYSRNERNLGAAKNFNTAFENTTGELMMWAAADDQWEPTFIERCVEALDNDPGLVLAMTGVQMVGDHGENLAFDENSGLFIDSERGPVMGPEPTGIGSSDRPEVRFRRALWELKWCFPQMGVMRREPTAQTNLFQGYYGSDKVFVAELAMLGRFHETDQLLFKKRVHSGASFRMSTKERAEFMAAGEWHGLPQARMMRDYQRLIRTTPLSGRQRMHCYATLAGMLRREGLWKRVLVPSRDNYLVALATGRRRS